MEKQNVTLQALMNDPTKPVTSDEASKLMSDVLELIESKVKTNTPLKEDEKRGMLAVVKQSSNQQMEKFLMNLSVREAEIYGNEESSEYLICYLIAQNKEFASCLKKVIRTF